jgi:hypothetical protein
MHRVLAGAVTALASLGIALVAQTARDVTLTIDASPVTAGRTSIVHVTIQIPEGRFIPAETRGAVQGAWLQPAPGPFFDRDLANFPIPAVTSVPGTNRPILAFAGAVAVRMPLETPALAGTQPLELRFGYQLCDSRRCDPFRVLTALADLPLIQPPVTPGFVAARWSPSRVAIISDRNEPFDRSLPFPDRTPVRFVMPMAVLPDGHRSRAHFDGDFSVGSRWIISSSARQFTGVTDQPAVLNGGCEDIMPLVLGADVADPRFTGERAKFFLATPADGSPARLKSMTTPFRLSANQQQDLDTLLDRLMRVTVPSVFAPIPEHRPRPLSPSEQRHIAAILNGEGRLVTHVEAFALAPDADPRLYVRAYWALGGVARIGLTSWIRVSGTNLIVERSDASLSRFADSGEMKMLGSDVAAQSRFAGELLNVIASPDGWAYVIIGRSGYEGMGVTIYKYSADGPIETGISYSHGC